MLAATLLKLSRDEYALCRKASMLRLLQVREDQPGCRALHRREGESSMYICTLVDGFTSDGA